MSKFYEELIQKINKENILLDEPMSKHTSFKIGGNADYYITATSIENLKNILETAKENNIDTYVVGNGTNLLVRDNGFRGAIVKLGFNKINILDDKIIADAGASLVLLARLAADNNITGFEGLSGIPGTIGGAVRMNAGAYGTEIKDVLIESKYLGEDGNIYTITNEEHEFDYRKSIFKNNKGIILESIFKIEKGNKEEIENQMKENSAKRISSQPLDKPNAGSTFKRGDGFITAKLIDDAGLKGYKIGGAQISTKHAGFIINDEAATAEDIIKLIKYTKDVIKEKFDKEIETEIIIIGE